MLALKRDRHAAIRRLVAERPIGSPGRARRGAVHARVRRHPGDREPRHRGARPRQGHARRPLGRTCNPEALGREARPPSDERLRRILADIPVTVGRSGLILVLTGQPGTANVIAQAIDESTLTEQVGTVAGDNTLIVLFPDEPALERWLARFDIAPGAGGAGDDPNGGSRQMKKVVLAYSGGLDTSVAVAWLKEQYGVEVVTLTVDLGGGSIREGVERRAMRAGRVEGVRRRRARRRSSASTSGARSRPARSTRARTRSPPRSRGRCSRSCSSRSPSSEGADAVAHGCTGKGNDQVRFDVAVHALDPGLEVVAPMRVGMGLTRDQSIDYANARGIELPITKSSPYSIDVNLWGRSCETGVLEDPWVTPPDDAYAWTVKPVRRAGPGRHRHRLRGRHPGLDRRRAAGRRRARRAAPRPRRRARRRADRPRRGPARRHQEPRDLRGAGGGDPPRRAPRARGPGPVEGAAPVQPARRRRARPDRSTTACGSAPCRATCGRTRCRRSGWSRARSGCASTTAGASVVGRRSPAEPVRQEPRHVRRGRRVRPRGRGGLHRDLRAPAPGRGRAPRRRRQAPRGGLDVDGAAARGPARRPSPRGRARRAG